MHIFHKWRKPDYAKACGECFRAVRPGTPEKVCTFGLQVCRTCGKVRGWGSHGKFSVIPDSCRKAYNSVFRERTL